MKKGGKILAISVLLLMIVPVFAEAAYIEPPHHTRIRCRVVSYTRNPDGSYTLGLIRAETGPYPIYIKMWIDDPVLLGDLDLAIANRCLVDLEFSKDWCRTPALVLEDVIIPGASGPP